MRNDVMSDPNTATEVEGGVYILRPTLVQNIFLFTVIM